MEQLPNNEHKEQYNYKFFSWLKDKIQKVWKDLQQQIAIFRNSLKDDVGPASDEARLRVENSPYTIQQLVNKLDPEGPSVFSYGKWARDYPLSPEEIKYLTEKPENLGFDLSKLRGGEKGQIALRVLSVIGASLIASGSFANNNTEGLDSSSPTIVSFGDLDNTDMAEKVLAEHEIEQDTTPVSIMRNGLLPAKKKIETEAQTTTTKTKEKVPPAPQTKSAKDMFGSYELVQGEGVEENGSDTLKIIGYGHLAGQDNRPFYKKINTKDAGIEGPLNLPSGAKSEKLPFSLSGRFPENKFFWIWNVSSKDGKTGVAYLMKINKKELEDNIVQYTQNGKIYFFLENCKNRIEIVFLPEVKEEEEQIKKTEEKKPMYESAPQLEEYNYDFKNVLGIPKKRALGLVKEVYIESSQMGEFFQKHERLESLDQICVVVQEEREIKNDKGEEIVGIFNIYYPAKIISNGLGLNIYAPNYNKKPVYAHPDEGTASVLSKSPSFRQTIYDYWGRRVAHFNLIYREFDSYKPKEAYEVTAYEVGENGEKGGYDYFKEVEEKVKKYTELHSQHEDLFKKVQNRIKYPLSDKQEMTNFILDNSISRRYVQITAEKLEYDIEIEKLKYKIFLQNKIDEQERNFDLINECNLRIKLFEAKKDLAILKHKHWESFKTEKREGRQDDWDFSNLVNEIKVKEKVVKDLEKEIKEKYGLSSVDKQENKDAFVDNSRIIKQNKKEAQAGKINSGLIKGSQRMG